MLNTEEYGRAIWQAYANDDKLGEIKQSVRFFDYDWSYDGNGYPVLNSVKPVEWLNTAKTMRSADTNWIDEISRTGVSQNHQISVSSGTENHVLSSTWVMKIRKVSRLKPSGRNIRPA